MVSTRKPAQQNGTPINSSGFSANFRLCPREKLCSLGFPASPDQASGMGVGILPVVEPARADQFSGNAMHFSNVAVVQLVALSCFARIQ